MRAHRFLLLVMTLLLLLSGLAFAQSSSKPPGPPPSVGGNVVVRPNVEQPEAAPGGLAVTGAGVVLFTALGLGVIGLGAVVLLLTRRTPAASRESSNRP